MIKTGLVSVSFRDLTPKEIVCLAYKADIDSIEWGGDIHVPPKDITKAKEVFNITKDKGIEISAYGSYYRFNENDKELDDFKYVLEIAQEIKAPTIRIWAGNQSSENTDEKEWVGLINRINKAANIAKDENISLSFEFHNGTLTDTNESAYRLLNDINNKNVYSYWQTNVDFTFNEQKQGLESLLPYLSNIHVFNWCIGENKEIIRYQLNEGKKKWSEFFSIIAKDNKERYASLEFIKNNSKEQFLEDAVTLKELLKAY